MKNSLFFSAPAETWEHYLPLGNGRLGCMVKTHPCNEVIQLNEEGIWSGGPQNRLNPDTKKNLKKIRELVREGKVLEAQRLGFETMSGMGFNDRVYQTAGDLKIDFFSANDSGIAVGWPLAHKFSQKCLDSYKSELDMDNSCAVISYTDENGVNFIRRIWASAVDDLIFMHVSCDKKGALNFSGYLDRGIWSDSVHSSDGFIFLEDSHGIPFCAGVGVVVNGAQSCRWGVRGGNLYGENCDEALFFIDIQAWKWNEKAVDKTSYDKLIRKNTWSGKCREKLERVRDYVKMRGVGVAAEDYLGWHIVEWRTYWERFALSIGESSFGQSDSEIVFEIPTPELLQKASVSNVELVNLYAAFSRYLMISGSRKPGMLPLTLQGLWNCYMDPPWGSKYTININAQMNYWAANMTGLSDCENPLFYLLERAYERGVVAARELYGCRGYVLHHNTDCWGDAAPQDAWIPGTYWVLGAAWLATHIIEHYEYTLDKAFLARYYYLMHEAALFFVDFLVPCDLTAPDGNPYLVINPSLSPENSYVTKTCEVGAFTEGCEMDNMILEHLFAGIQRAKKVLGDDARNQKGKSYKKADFDSFDYILAHLKEPSLNSDGSLMEWNHEVEEVEPGHRHISHLYGLFPGHTITVERTPELAEACRKTLEKRLSNGGGHTGWSQAWIINFYAQLGMGNEALSSIIKLLQHSTLPNLLDNHPPFQIDGNFGTLAGIIRLLVQSEFDDNGNVHVKLLPALPAEKAWQNGSVRGVAIKGGYTLDFEWKNGKVVRKELYPGKFAIQKEKIILA